MTSIRKTPSWVTSAFPTQLEDFHLAVNGKERWVQCPRDTPLLYVLRNDLRMTGARFGCGLGQCGACFVLVDGRATASCDLPVWFAAGHEITTIEGLAESGELGALQQAFIVEQAAQCGYCMSGILVSAAGLLRTNPAPSDDDICRALDSNLCRCGSHVRVMRAIRRCARDTVKGPAR